MKKSLALMAVMLLVGFSCAQAGILSDAQMAQVYAGDDSSINDVITAENSAVSNQKNIAAVGSLSLGTVSDSVMDNLNTAVVANTGDSGVAMQLNIGAVSGMGEEGDNLNNVITNSNDAQVDNLVIAPAETVEATSDGLTTAGAGTNSSLVTVSAVGSAVCSQGNIGAVAGTSNVLATVITNVNNAVVTNGLAI